MLHSGEFVDLDDGTRYILVENSIYSIPTNFKARFELGGKVATFISDVPVGVGLLRQVGGW